ncbi:hypothetical protein SAMN04488069_1421 [Hymenobacter psychrophilus]|uniref:Uncharacterized protein n=2 Tax=Hymenobacter psychrophilus TaxID=651662 RepID=A0A1H3PM89_9BACT|nr:hypothetical protein SAMN04488069_1421 [Hymenobacter psychrophilus]
MSPMSPHNQQAYRALRAYLTYLLANQRDKALSEVPLLFRASVELFMQGKTMYADAADQPIIYAHDLAAWAYQVIYVSGLEYPLPLAAVDVDCLRRAMEG